MFVNSCKKRLRQKDLSETFEKDSFYDADGTIGLYRENCTQEQYIPTEIERCIRKKSRKLEYIENFPNGIKIKFSDGKLETLQIGGKTYSK